MTSATPERLIVADASPLIGLVKIKRLGLLTQLAEDIWIPRVVWNELIAGGSGRSEVGELMDFLANAVRDVDPALTGDFVNQVDAGEAAAVALAAANPGCLLLIDDAAGRRLAESHDIRCIGVGGILLRAKRIGLIPSLAVELKALRQHGYFLGDGLIAHLLVAAGETSET